MVLPLLRSFETFGEAPYLVGKLASAYVEGIQSRKVISVVKHFACNNQENGRGTNNVIVNERTLREIYLPAFKRCVRDANALGIMSAYNKVNGPYCSENTHLLSEILKDEWGFKGFVVSDWNTTGELLEHGSVSSPADAAYRAFNAGVDMDVCENETSISLNGNSMNYSSVLWTTSNGAGIISNANKL